MSEYNVPYFVIACSARVKGNNYNIGDIVTCDMLPLDVFHQFLTDGRYDSVRLCSHDISSFKSNMGISFIELLGAMPSIKKYPALKAKQGELAEAYLFCLNEIIKDNGEIIYGGPLQTKRPFSCPKYERLIATDFSNNPQCLDLLIKRPKIIDGKKQDVDIQVRLAYGKYMGKMHSTEQGKTYAKDEVLRPSDIDTLKDIARIKDNSFFMQFDSQQFQKQ